MKKYIPIAFIAVFIIFISGMAVLSRSNNSKIIKYRIIDVTDEYIEVKKGRTELTLYTSEDTVYIAKDGTETDGAIIEICQYVNVYYTTQGNQKLLKKIVIIKESDCIK